MARRYSKTRNEGFKEALGRAPAPASGGAQANGRRPGKARASAAGARGLEGVLAHPVEALVAASRPVARALGVAAALLIVVGFALFMYEEWGPGVGAAALAARLLGALGIALFGAGMLIVLVMLVVPAGRAWRAAGPDERRATRGRLVRQLGVAALNVLVYGGYVLLMLGGLAALDHLAGAALLVVAGLWAACIAGIVAYRRHRKRHRVGYQLAATVFLPAFLVVVGLFSLTGASLQALDAAADLRDGPVTAEARLAHVAYDRPSGRYRAFLQTQAKLRFALADGGEVTLWVPEGEAAVLNALYATRIGKDRPGSDGLGSPLALSWYPRTRVLASADLP